MRKFKNIIMEENKYEIKTISQLVDIVTDENRERISTDLVNWLDITNQTYNIIKALNPELKDKLNSEIAQPTFVWIDDGKNDIKGIEWTDKEGNKEEINF